MKEAEKFTGLAKLDRQEYNGECKNRMYGDIWLLKQVAVKTGIKQDLENVFNNNRKIVDDI